jgi:hypothetical protein
MSKEKSKREVEKELAGHETEPHEIIHFKVYRTQIPVFDQPIETAALMLGSDKSRGYCLEMICADFLAGANLRQCKSRDSVALNTTVLQVPARRATTRNSRPSESEAFMSRPRPKQPRLRLDAEAYE